MMISDDGDAVIWISAASHHPESGHAACDAIHDHDGLFTIPEDYRTVTPIPDEAHTFIHYHILDVDTFPYQDSIAVRCIINCIHRKKRKQRGFRRSL